jgi:hypothetical protein
MSFGWTGFFRAGAWRAYRTFILNQRRDVVARLTTINAELDRIGEVQILYEANASNPTRMTERRIGLDVTPNTSIERLLRAYVAMGGNPFDISMFLSPNSVTMIEDDTTQSQTTDSNPQATPATNFQETQPYGGIAASGSADPLAGGTYTGGWLPLWRYPPRRFGNATSYTQQSADMTRTIHATRGWVAQEIRTLRNDLEARIIKLMDLREQLMIERDELLPQAVGGSVAGLQWASDGEFAASHNVSAIVDRIDAVFYPNTLNDGSRNYNQPRQTGPNPTEPMLLDDAPNGEEDWTAIG